MAKSSSLTFGSAGPQVFLSGTPLGSLGRLREIYLVILLAGERHSYVTAWPGQSSAPSFLPDVMQAVIRNPLTKPSGTRLTSREGANQNPARLSPVHHGQNATQRKRQRPGPLTLYSWKVSKDEATFILLNCLFLLRGGRDEKVFLKVKERYHGTRKGGCKMCKPFIKR